MVVTKAKSNIMKHVKLNDSIGDENEMAIVMREVAMRLRRHKALHIRSPLAQSHSSEQFHRASLAPQHFDLKIVIEYDDILDYYLVETAREAPAIDNYQVLNSGVVPVVSHHDNVALCMFDKQSAQSH